MKAEVTYPAGDTYSVRDVFEHEEYDFNPALREAVDTFGRQVFGYELEVVDYEEQLTNGEDLGRYDILAQEPLTETHILIEIQYGKFNHDHITRGLEYVMNLDIDVDYAVCLGESFSKNTVELIYEYFDEILLPVQMCLEKMVTSDGEELQPALRFSAPETDSGMVYTEADEMLTEARRDMARKVSERKMKSPQIVLNRAESVVKDLYGVSVNEVRDKVVIFDVIPNRYSEPIEGVDLKIQNREDFMRLRSPFLYEEDEEVIEKKIEELDKLGIDNLVGMDVTIKRRNDVGRHTKTGIWIIYNEYEVIAGNEDDIVGDLESVAEALTGELGHCIKEIVNE